MSKPTFTPLQYTDGTHTEPAPGFVVDPVRMPVDEAATNLLKNTAEGLLVQAADLVSTQPDNTLSVAIDGKLFNPPAAPVDPRDLVSQVAGNKLRVEATDNKLFADPTTPLELRSVDADNQIEFGTDGNLTVKPIDIWDHISNDANNAIVRGGDDNPFVKEVTAVSLRSKDVDNSIAIGTDGGLKYTERDILAYLLANKDKLVEMILSTCEGNVMEAGCDGGLYAACCEDMAIAGDDPHLYIDINGALASVVRLGYNPSTNTITLLGREGRVIDSHVLNAGGSVLKEAQLVDNPSGQPEGTYLQLTFTTASGTDETVYIDVTKLVDIVTAGNAGIRVTDQAVFLVVDGTQDIIYIDPDNGLTIDVTKLNSTENSNSIIIDGTGKFSYQVTTTTPRTVGIAKTATGQSVSVPLYDQAATGGNPIVANADTGIIGLGIDKSLLVQNIAANLIRPNVQGVTLIASDLISTDSNNSISTGTDGKIKVVVTDTQYTSANNALDVTGTVLTVKLDSTQNLNPLVIRNGATGGLGVDKRLIVSDTSGNYITPRVDGVYLASGDILSTKSGQLIETDVVQGGVGLVGKLLLTADSLKSTDADNVLQTGTDGKLLVKPSQGTPEPSRLPVYLASADVYTMIPGDRNTIMVTAKDAGDGSISATRITIRTMFGSDAAVNIPESGTGLDLTPYRNKGVIISRQTTGVAPSVVVAMLTLE